MCTTDPQLLYWDILLTFSLLPGLCTLFSEVSAAPPACAWHQATEHTGPLPGPVSGSTACTGGPCSLSQGTGEQRRKVNVTSGPYPEEMRLRGQRGMFPCVWYSDHCLSSDWEARRLPKWERCNNPTFSLTGISSEFSVMFYFNIWNVYLWY